MSDDAFHSLVNDDLRKLTSPEVATVLHSPAVFERWWGTLVAMEKSLDGQLGSRRDEYQGAAAELIEALAVAKATGDTKAYRQAESDLNRLRSRYHRGRASSLRFKSGLDEFLTRARTIRRMRAGS